MKFITFVRKDGEVRAGWIQENRFAVDMHEVSSGRLPTSLLEFLENCEENMKVVKELQALPHGCGGKIPLAEVTLKAPIPIPKSLRDFYAFEQHVKSARENRGLEMIPEWYEIPVFYFSNHLAIKGPSDAIVKPKECSCLDYELEIACIIGKEGRNISAESADEYIFGYCILNDWSARDFQRKEMKVGLGPAKGKDFATSLGPWIVTKDELQSLRAVKGFNLTMKAYVNGRQLSEGNMRDLYYSFGEMIERASQDVTLYPGEIIGSGTVGTGCLLEIGHDQHRWLVPGDQVELEVEYLGRLKNIIVDCEEVF